MESVAMSSLRLAQVCFRSSMPDLDPDVRAYHERGEEAARLTEKNPIEFVRTTQILSRVLPPAPAHIVDVGGGPGAYARWLCARDYEVELVDPVALHIEQANEPGTPGLTARIGDGRHLDIGNEATDAVLLMGPLYHLTDTDDRVTTLPRVLANPPTWGCGGRRRDQPVGPAVRRGHPRGVGSGGVRRVVGDARGDRESTRRRCAGVHYSALPPALRTCAARWRGQGSAISI